MNIQKDYEGFFESLNLEKANYLIIGAFAVGYYGIPRTTGDIDVFVGSTPANAEKVIGALRRFGFKPKDLTSEDFKNPDLVVQLGCEPLRIDILTSISGVPFQKAWKNRVRAKYGLTHVWYISREDLIANKRSSGRIKDKVDLELLTMRRKRRLSR